MLLMIDNYDSFTYNLVQYLGELGQDVRVHRNDQITVTDIESLAPDSIVISPGPCTPNEAGVSMAVIERFRDTIPILGVVFCVYLMVSLVLMPLWRWWARLILRPDAYCQLKFDALPFHHRHYFHVAALHRCLKFGQRTRRQRVGVVVHGNHVFGFDPGVGCKGCVFRTHGEIAAYWHQHHIRN